MAPLVKLRDVVEEMTLVSENVRAFLNTQTGEMISLTSEEISAVEDDTDVDALSDWEKEAIAKAREVLESDDYLELPDKFEINEYSIMEDFCNQIPNDRVRNELFSQIRGSGAFRRFYAALERHGITQEWYEYYREALEAVAIRWLQAYKVEFE